MRNQRISKREKTDLPHKPTILRRDRSSKAGSCYGVQSTLSVDPLAAHHSRLAYQSIGVIYGDIGTSPLYVYSSTFSSDPSYDGIIEVLSVIIWSIIIVVTVKYILIILHADNEGEGGTFSTYSLLTRYVSCLQRAHL